MKKAIPSLVIANALSIGVVLNGCDSPPKDDNDTYERMYFARQSSETLRKEYDTLVYSGISVKHWEKFRQNSEKLIQRNEYLIEELKTKIRKTGRQSDLIFERKVYILEQKNKNLRDRILSYPEVQSDWNSFKKEITGELVDIAMEIKESGNNRPARP